MEEEWENLPLSEKFQHKNWKVRKQGYEAATQQFKEAKPEAAVVREFVADSAVWKGVVTDSNVAAQQEGLSAYNAFLEKASTEGARKTRSQTVQGVVEKGLTGRPAAKAAAQETLLLLIELDRPDPVVEELFPLLAHKQPKIIATTLAALTAIVHAYGCRTIEPKAILKTLPKAFGHADKNVRAEASNLAVEMYRWLRAGMKPFFWDELKEVQQKDLDKLFEPISQEPTPEATRLLLSQQAVKEQAEAVAAEKAEEEAEAEEEEAAGFDLAIDVLPKIPKDFQERLASAKWKDRKEVLDETMEIINIPSIVDGRFDDIVKSLAKCMKDANIMVVIVAANCVECLAKGLKKAFARYRSTILAPMLERFKEKKQNVTDAISAACDAVFKSTGLNDTEADIMEALQNKNPQVKDSTGKFLVRCLKATRQAPSLDQAKELSDISKKLLAESVASVRDTGAEVLGVLLKIMGEKVMLPHIETLDDIRQKKIKEFSEAAEVKAKYRPKPVAPPPATKGPPGKKALPGKRPLAKKPAAAPASAAAVAKPMSPPPVEEPQQTTKPIPKSRLGLKPPGAKTIPSLKPPTPATSAISSSPKRNAVDEPKPVGIGKGLAGRSLGLAQPTPSQTSSQSTTPAPPAREPSLSDVEREELESLRAEVELLRTQLADSRSDKIRLGMTITELQNQNAQLIEDHTRDVLQIKAKETQLVRARSAAEAAEEKSARLEAMLHRQEGGPPLRSEKEDYDARAGDEFKENTPYIAGFHAPRSQPHSRSASATNSVGSDRLAGANRVRSPPPSSSTLSTSRIGKAPAAQQQTSGETESWKRAAEVTQNLKARIELMKAKQLKR
ncbi:ARM repeat-containing protein [Piedraia hortae CBS 480.64]|uniref:ARM repeat-containing protein n=1 Tax=Piedraia hortae CBS 480.64 TaxID=1314780 RepID=A0A6A7BZQ2_9PEZI|nr:ARM repeat-containing protein [Piedraia hortae CBS 480.64]